MARELRLDNVRGAEAAEYALEGEGEREGRRGAARLRLVKEGTDGEVRPCLAAVPGAASWYGWLCAAAWAAWSWAAECFGLAGPVRSRKAAGAAAGAPCRSMSSKCDRSAGPRQSESVDECRLDDLDDLELVRSGGLPGGGEPPKAAAGASCGELTVAMRRLSKASAGGHGQSPSCSRRHARTGTGGRFVTLGSVVCRR